MMKTRLVVVALLSLAVALPAAGKTYKSTYPVACSEVWSAVQDTLSNPENYNVVEKDDAKMTASYNVRDTPLMSPSPGRPLQRTNHVTLVSKGTGCEMQVVSRESCTFEHNDKGDFKQRVDESLAKLQAAPPAQAAKPEAPAK